ncbi:MAG: 2-amino-4-hydroxy-6-hydroxymethyldihydropteridine diphosphokinase [Agathobacter sp.]|nr:2-amino-4-hydroxy-6-hydroxymethyldihydropteridine diphosphokinase [Agathobacter sp.]
MDYIYIKGLQIFANHGVLQEEKNMGQFFYVNAKCYYDMQKAALNDDINLALNYAEVCEYIVKVFTEETFDLIETVAERVVESLLEHYDILEQVDLELRKPSAPIGLPFEDVSINISRKWNNVALSFGSNMGFKEVTLNNAIEKISSNPKIKDVKISDFIVTKPYGGVEQDDFLNGCMVFKTTLNPQSLLDYLHTIENEAGRTREIHWGPRTLDLDIIFYDKMVYESEDLIIPHVDMQNRYFVLKPLSQLWPNFRHPIYNTTVEQMLHEVERVEDNESNFI